MRVGNLINALDNVSVLNPEVVSERKARSNSSSGKVPRIGAGLIKPGSVGYLNPGIADVTARQRALDPGIERSFPSFCSGYYGF